MDNLRSRMASHSIRQYGKASQHCLQNAHVTHNKTMIITIDKRSGFCFGVVNAVKQAEKQLDKHGVLHCLGEIVHNEGELKRLGEKGLVTISKNELDTLPLQRVMFRAHGEAPEQYKKLQGNGVEIVDATCPVVLRLQKKVSSEWKKMLEGSGQVVIYGKKGHPEVIGLSGHTNGEAIVIERFEDIEQLNLSLPIALFAQTTMCPEHYSLIAKGIRQGMEKKIGSKSIPLKVYNSICGQVVARKKQLSEFAKESDCIVFVCGKGSSNGRMLFEVCKNYNPNCFQISSPSELNGQWFEGFSSIGVSGATSTPLWLLEEVAASLWQMFPGDAK